MLRCHSRVDHALKMLVIRQGYTNASGLHQLMVKDWEIFGDWKVETIGDPGAIEGYVCRPDLDTLLCQVSIFR